MRDRTFKMKTPQDQVQKTTQDQIDKIREEGRKALELLNNPMFINYLKSAKLEIEQIHASQSLQDSKEETEVNGVKKTLYFPAKKEYMLLAGQYRFIDQMIGDFNQSVEIAKDLEERIASKQITIEGDDHADAKV